MVSSVYGSRRVCSHLDTPGFFTRSITDFSAFTQEWLHGSSLPQQTTDENTTLKTSFNAAPERKPTRILMSEEGIQILVRTQLGSFGGFLSDLERYCGVKSTTMRVGKIWDSDRPAGVTTTRHEYLATVRTSNTMMVDKSADNLQDSRPHPTPRFVSK